MTRRRRISNQLQHESTALLTAANVQQHNTCVRKLSVSSHHFSCTQLRRLQKQAVTESVMPLVFYRDEYFKRVNRFWCNATSNTTRPLVCHDRSKFWVLAEHRLAEVAIVSLWIHVLTYHLAFPHIISHHGEALPVVQPTALQP